MASSKFSLTSDRPRGMSPVSIRWRLRSMTAMPVLAVRQAKGLAASAPVPAALLHHLLVVGDGVWMLLAVSKLRIGSGVSMMPMAAVVFLSGSTPFFMALRERMSQIESPSSAVAVGTRAGCGKGRGSAEGGHRSQELAPGQRACSHQSSQEAGSTAKIPFASQQRPQRRSTSCEASGGHAENGNAGGAGK